MSLVSGEDNFLWLTICTWTFRVSQIVLSTEEKRVNYRTDAVVEVDEKVLVIWQKKKKHEVQYGCIWVSAIHYHILIER